MKIEDLSNDKLKLLIEQYYKNDCSVKKLLESNGVKYSSNFIQKATLYADEECEVCGGRMKYKLVSRSYCNSINDLKKICSVCGHDGTENCQCKECVEFRKLKREEIENKKREIIKNACRMENIEVKDLNIRELIFIGLLKENKISERLGKLAQKDYFKRIYSYEEDCIKFLNNMYSRKVINVDADNSELSNFTIKEDGYISYRPYCVEYCLNVKVDIKEIDIKSEIKKDLIMKS